MRLLVFSPNPSTPSFQPCMLYIIFPKSPLYQKIDADNSHFKKGTKQTGGLDKRWIEYIGYSILRVCRLSQTCFVYQMGGSVWAVDFFVQVDFFIAFEAGLLQATAVTIA
jgi:hypothetical protein